MSTVFSADGTAIGFDAWGDGPPLGWEEKIHMLRREIH